MRFFFTNKFYNFIISFDDNLIEEEKEQKLIKSYFDEREKIF